MLQVLSQHLLKTSISFMSKRSHASTVCSWTYTMHIYTYTAHFHRLGFMLLAESKSPELHASIVHVYIGTCCFTLTYLLDHFFKLLFLILPELLVVLHRRDMEPVLGLGLWRFKRTSQDSHLGIANLLQEGRREKYSTANEINITRLNQESTLHFTDLLRAQSISHSI